MPTFDVVSEIDQQEVRNAVDQASREVGESLRLQGHRQQDRADRQDHRARHRERSAAHRAHAGARGEAGEAQGVTEGAVVRQDRGSIEGARASDGDAQRRDLVRQGPRDRQVPQGPRPQGRAAPGPGRRSCGSRARSATTCRRRSRRCATTTSASRSSSPTSATERRSGRRSRTDSSPGGGRRALRSAGGCGSSSPKLGSAGACRGCRGAALSSLWNGLMMKAFSCAGFTFSSGSAWRRRRSSRAPGRSGSPVPSNCGATGVGLVLARPRDRHLDQPGGERGEDQHARARRSRRAGRRRRHHRRTARSTSRMRAMNVIAIATAAATDPMRMSRCFTCAISWASTPLSSSGGSTSTDALGDAHDRVVRVAAGGEGVGLLLGRHVDRAASGSAPAGRGRRPSRTARGPRPGSPAWPEPRRWPACRRTSRCRRRRRARSRARSPGPTTRRSRRPTTMNDRAEEGEQHGGLESVLHCSTSIGARESERLSPVTDTPASTFDRAAVPI